MFPLLKGSKNFETFKIRMRLQERKKVSAFQVGEYSCCIRSGLELLGLLRGGGVLGKKNIYKTL